MLSKSIYIGIEDGGLGLTMNQIGQSLPISCSTVGSYQSLLMFVIRYYAQHKRSRRHSCPDCFLSNRPAQIWHHTSPEMRKISIPDMFPQLTSHWPDHAKSLFRCEDRQLSLYTGGNGRLGNLTCPQMLWKHVHWYVPSSSSLIVISVFLASCLLIWCLFSMYHSTHQCLLTES